MNIWNKIHFFYMFAGSILLICSCSQNYHESGNKSEDYKDSSEKTMEIMNLENDSLSLSNIKAFEQRALQKLEDLKDYFEILSDHKIDTVFRNQAIFMACQLFASNENQITLNLVKDQNKPVQNIESFFKSIQQGNLGNLSFEIHDVSLIKRIEHTDETAYKGAIRFRLYVLEKQNNTQIISNKADMECEIIAKKIQKKFGKDSKLVWEVFLGNIFQVQEEN